MALFLTPVHVQVYKARLDGISNVAVKILKPEGHTNAQLRENFRKEISILSACRDPNIVLFLGAFQMPVSQYKNRKIVVGSGMYRVFSYQAIVAQFSLCSCKHDVAKKVLWC